MQFTMAAIKYVGDIVILFKILKHALKYLKTPAKSIYV